MLTDSEIRKQSEQAVRQWDTLWSENSKIHKEKFPNMKNLDDFKNVGIGKSLILAANGASLESEINKLKGSNVMCCDKTLGHLIKNGIKPKYCLVCDANVDYDEYLRPYENDLDETILFMCVTGNTKWSLNGNWKDIYFFANKDILESEKKYMALSGCPNSIPAATNVSNAMIVFLTQSDNSGPRNFFGYDVYGLIGFDYSWQRNGSYYAFNKDGDGKANYMRHIYLKDVDGNDIYTSTNLQFSAKWITKYVQTFNLPIVQCSNKTIFQTSKVLPLETISSYNFKEEDCEIVKTKSKIARQLKHDLDTIMSELNKIGSEHSKRFFSLCQYRRKYRLPKESPQYLHLSPASYDGRCGSDIPDHQSLNAISE